MALKQTVRAGRRGELSVFFGCAWAARTLYHLRPQQAGACPGVGDAFLSSAASVIWAASAAAG